MVVVADDRRGVFSGILQVLRDTRDDRTGDAAVRADPRAVKDGDVGANPGCRDRFRHRRQWW